MDNMMPGCVGGLDPANIPDWLDELVDICDDCDKMSEDCECDNPSGFHKDYVYKCPDCYRLFRDDSQLDHDCEGWQPDEDDALNWVDLYS